MVSLAQLRQGQAGREGGVAVPAWLRGPQRGAVGTPARAATGTPRACSVSTTAPLFSTAIE